MAEFSTDDDQIIDSQVFRVCKASPNDPLFHDAFFAFAKQCKTHAARRSDKERQIVSLLSRRLARAPPQAKPSEEVNYRCALKSSESGELDDDTVVRELEKLVRPDQYAQLLGLRQQHTAIDFNFAPQNLADYFTWYQSSHSFLSDVAATPQVSSLTLEGIVQDLFADFPAPKSLQDLLRQKKQQELQQRKQHEMVPVPLPTAGAWSGSAIGFGDLDAVSWSTTSPGILSSSSSSSDNDDDEDHAPSPLHSNMTDNNTTTATNNNNKRPAPPPPTSSPVPPGSVPPPPTSSFVPGSMPPLKKIKCDFSLFGSSPPLEVGPLELKPPFQELINSLVNPTVVTLAGMAGTPATSQCPVCDKEFRGKNCKHDLKDHLNSHLGIKKFNCRFCAKSFAQRSSRGRHEQKHKGISWKCTLCESAFSRKDVCVKHVPACAELKGITLAHPSDACGIVSQFAKTSATTATTTPMTIAAPQAQPAAIVAVEIMVPVVPPPEVFNPVPQPAITMSHHKQLKHFFKLVLQHRHRVLRKTGDKPMIGSTITDDLWRCVAICNALVHHDATLIFSVCKRVEGRSKVKEPAAIGQLLLLLTVRQILCVLTKKFFKGYHCEYCKRQLANRSALQRHYQLHDTSQSAPFPHLGLSPAVLALPVAPVEPAQQIVFNFDAYFE